MSDLCSDSQAIYILYGSQTGQAQGIAEDIYEECLDRQIDSLLFCLDQHGQKFNISQVSKAIFIMSTTGDGDPPDNAAKFVRKLKRKSLPRNYLSNLTYTLLGLGDTNYNNFCNGGKTLNGLLTTLGAKSFYPSGYADDAVGLEIVVEPWKDKLWTAIQKMLQLQIHNMDNVNKLASATDDVTIINTESQPESSQGLPKNSSVTDSELMNITADHDNVTNEPVNQVSEIVKEMKVTSEETSQSNSKDNSSALNEIIELESKLKNCDTSFPDDLTFPSLPIPYLDIDISDADQPSTDKFDAVANCDYTYKCIGARTDIVLASVQQAQYLTSDNAVKKVLELALHQSDASIEFAPGDSINVYCPNNEEEVSWVISRLDLGSIQNKIFSLQIDSETKKRLPKIPKHIPKQCTVKEAIAFHCDIRSIPKKATLRMLAEYTDNSNEKKRLLQLSSREGGDDYTNLLCKYSISFLDILAAFPSCRPPFIRIIEQLPQLQPRPYSIVNSPIQDKEIIKIALTIVQLPPSIAIKKPRKGLCSGWLQLITKHIHSPHLLPNDRIIPLRKIGISSRKIQNFNLPEDKGLPLIMIGAGTGISPYIGFLEHRWLKNKESLHTDSCSTSLLFYGCRHKDRDYLYRDLINVYLERKILTQHYVAFSRELYQDLEDNFPRYVQDCLRQQSDKIMHLLFEKSAVIYVCGDAQGMAKDVMNTLIDLIERYKGVSQDEAYKTILAMMKEKRYRQDIWA